MDAASKTGVDDIRDIIDNVKYKPVNCKYKIFIIDEVHMLSKNAFNALLKTLEEPPDHIKFIFATTEVKKIPITIISRCQRFDLQRIDNVNLTQHLTSIAKKENIDIEIDAMALIVRAADGSVRDGLSLLDQAIANEKNQITSISIISMLGLADRGNIFDLMDAIFQGNTASALKIYNRIYQSGADVIMIFDELLNVMHFITQIKIAPELKDDVHIPELERVKGAEMAKKISMASLGMIWQVLFKGYEELQSGFHLFQHGEMIIIRLIYFYDGPTPDDLVKKYEDNITSFQNIKNASIPSQLDNEKHSTINKEKQSINEDLQISNINTGRDTKETINPSNVLTIKSYRNFVNMFYQKKEGMLHAYLYNTARLVSFKEGELVINAESIPDTHFPRTIAKLVSKWTGRIWQVSTSTSNIAQTLYEEDLIQQKKEIEIMKNDLDIKAILKKFPEAKIHSITNINETIDENENFKNFKQKKEQ